MIFGSWAIRETNHLMISSDVVCCSLLLLYLLDLKLFVCIILSKNSFKFSNTLISTISSDNTFVDLSIPLFIALLGLFWLYWLISNFCGLTLNICYCVCYFCSYSWKQGMKKKPSGVELDCVSCNLERIKNCCYNVTVKEKTHNDFFSELRVSCQSRTIFS